MCEFIRPETLCADFQVFGHFYRLERPGGTPLRCRSTLEIVRRHVVEERGQALLERRPEHLTFMMNPGSSRALHDRDHNGHVVAAARVGGDAGRNLVEAYPDRVQYQIMRVMACLGLEHVRVLNLSDQRNARSPVFLRALGKGPRIPTHSILLRERAEELQSRLNPLHPLVIVAWGQDDRLTGLAAEAIGMLGENSLRPVGRRTNEPLLFGYPSPPGRSAEWLLEWVREVAMGLRN